MAFWARSNGSTDKTQWQMLKDHLMGVAERTKAFAEAFDAGALGWATGLCHDLGKYSTDFQKRLEDPRVKVDHSTAGAVVSYETFGKAIGRTMAYAIAGHHTGLPNGGDRNEADLLFRLKDKAINDFSAYKNEIEIPARVDPPHLRPLSKETLGFSVSFFIRMLFSCLVDADALDAEQFTDSEKSGLRGHDEPLDVLEKRLMEHLKRLTAHASPTLVNRKRAEVLRDCLAAAEQPPGLFTLTVPTGGAKTLSSLAFALKHARLNGLCRVIYVIPFTSIIEQNAEVFRKAIGSDAVLEHHSNAAHEKREYEDVTSPLELAEQNWDMPVVVTTNVQFFESLFSNRPSRCRKLHNVAKSVIILDEAQMLPVDLLKPCVAALDELVRNYGATVVLCSATQPALQGLLSGMTPAREIITDPAGLYRALKRVEVCDLGIVEDQDLAHTLLRERQALCIVNTRAHAKAVFELLGKSEGHYHLSAAMTPKHRSEILQEVRARLKASGSPDKRPVCRVVSTQLIEAGVDVDFPVVYRAIAGIDSIAQAAGRCNREGRLETANVYVFTPAARHGMSHVWFKRTASLAAGVLAEGNDPLSLDSVKRYFTDLYFYEGSPSSDAMGPSGLDKLGIMAELEIGGNSLDFPFREVADRFKIIGEDTVGVVIPRDDECRRLLELVKFRGISRRTLRPLQQYMVSIRPWEFQALRESGLLEDVEGLTVLWDLSAYDDFYGLVVKSSDKRGGDTWII